ncbi:putative M18 family aminopeptidase 2 [Tepiditoga spiralis]|uniref:Probable M18 family aminopeptidase 2 n=1 Tax=Tepiditoga spiralis TaxID=2108365 RepID=A0A7G1GB11_9BACT|nr:M18 family aminopeptidase [Tepiditoga spiralis]BBE31482.1 putative M18 family aminopeptidase 2 [Tepiditoga spiralis]
MNTEIKFAKELIDFIYESPTAFHAVKNVKNILLNSNFKELKENEKWNLKKEGKYFVTKNDSALIAFIVGTDEIGNSGFKLIGAHTDSPSFRIKPSPEIIVEKTYMKLNTEVYGGPILNTWMDRPLALAGRVTLKSENILNPNTKLININKPIMIIPNLAIHMNRKVNEGVELNKQKDLLPLLSMVNEKLEKENYLLNIIAKELEINPEEIIDFDLFLYEYEKGCIMGVNNEFISSPRLDDLAMVHAGIEAIKVAKPTKATNVMVCFDNEEVGSTTKQGANSDMLANILERITIALGGNREDFFRALSNSYIISADNAHAIHPNMPEKHDPTNKPVINKGPVIKINANQSYTTDSNSSAVYEMLCKNAGVPYQKFVNRSDVRGGSTIGPISSTHLNIRSIDIGNPQLAMHSIRELSGVLDHTYVKKSFDEFYKI